MNLGKLAADQGAQDKYAVLLLVILVAGFLVVTFLTYISVTLWSK